MLPKVKPSKKTIYLDHAGTTYVDPRVVSAMQPFWENYYGNPSSLYRKGRESKVAVTEARKGIAQILNCKPDEIIFTAGGTESVNLAIFGITRAFDLAQKVSAGKETGKKGHLIASAIEHHAVLRSLEALAEEGWQTSLIDVDRQGFINLDELKASVRADTVLISVMYANNEIGTIEPIAEIGKWLSGLNAQRTTQGLPKIYFHTDACQAAGALELDVTKLGIDLMSMNASKIYGPKQTGFLYIKSGVKLRPLIYGGGQERNLRSGTENVAGIVGLAKALQLADSGRTTESKRLRELRDYFINQIFKQISEVALNGPDERINNQASKPSRGMVRLPNNINISISDIEGEALLLYLDAYNICLSTGSACASTAQDPSHVILALGHDRERAYSSVRITIGKQTTKKDLDYVMKVMPGIVEELRRIKPVNRKVKRPGIGAGEKVLISKNIVKPANPKN